MWVYTLAKGSTEMTDNPVNEDNKTIRHREKRADDGEKQTDRDRPSERQVDEPAVLRRATKGKTASNPD